MSKLIFPKRLPPRKEEPLLSPPPPRNVLKPTAGLRQVLSLGGGIQSTAVFLMSLHGEIEMPAEFAIFADTGWERKATYAHVAYLREYAAGFGVDVHTVSSGKSIQSEALGGNDFAMPFFVKTRAGGLAPKRRQCTVDFKVKPFNRELRRLTGATYKTPVSVWLGFSVDEISRVKDSRVQYVQFRYPLLEKRMSRVDCQLWLSKNGFEIPPRSSCVGCPFHSDELWQDLNADEFADACAVDEAVRLSKHGKEQFLHRSGQPLRERPFVNDVQTELDIDVACGGTCFT